MDHWNEPQTDRLKRVDPVPDTNYARPAAALAAASQMMGTTVEQTFAALRQESEELQRLQVCTQSVSSCATHVARVRTMSIRLLHSCLIPMRRDGAAAGRGSSPSERVSGARARLHFGRRHVSIDAVTQTRGRLGSGADRVLGWCARHAAAADTSAHAGA
jgi:hypothetical protein